MGLLEIYLIGSAATGLFLLFNANINSQRINVIWKNIEEGGFNPSIMFGSALLVWMIVWPILPTIYFLRGISWVLGQILSIFVGPKKDV